MKTKSHPSPYWFLILLATSFITILVHGYLSVHGYNLKLGLESGQSLCNVSALFNCDSAAVSRYSSLGGIPMAVLGLIIQFALLVFLFSSQWHLSQYSELLRRFTFWLALFIAAVSVVMASISVFRLGTYCPFCLATYVLSFISVFAAFKLQTDNPSNHIASDFSLLLSSIRWPWLILIAVPALGFVSNKAILDSYGFGKIDFIVQDSLAQWEVSPPIDFKEDQALVFGNKINPKMTIVEFADFLCPHCRTAYPVLHAFVRSHPDTKLVFKNFPLDGKCNKSITQQGDGHRCKLAGSIYCAEKLFQKGWDFHHAFFDQQETMGTLDQFPKKLEDLSSQFQVSSAEIQKCLDEDSTLEAIQASALEGFNAKIQGTPSIFVNGKPLPRGQILPVLEAAYRKLNP